MLGNGPASAAEPSQVSSTSEVPRPPWQGLGRVGLGYATPPMRGFPSAGASLSILLGLRYRGLVLGLEGVYFTGATIKEIPPDVSVSGASEGHLSSMRGNLVSQYELRWRKLRVAPTLGVGLERTTLRVGSENISDSKQLVLFEGLDLGYELNSGFAVLLEQRIQQLRFDHEWGLNYWAQIAVEFSF